MMTIGINYTFLTVMIANLLATSGDFTMTWSSPMYMKLESNDSQNPLGYPISSDQGAWMGSLLNMGAIFGSIPFGYISEVFGRKTALLVLAVPHIVSYITMAFANEMFWLYGARVLSGLALGGGYTLLPMYISEIADDNNRGVYSVTLSMFWSIGNFLPYAVGPFLDVQKFNLLLASFPITFFILFLIWGIETPHWLIAQGKLENAQEVIILLRSIDCKEAAREIMKTSDDVTKEDGHFSDIMRNAKLRKSLFICIVLIIFQQLSGTTAISFYLQPILSDSGSTISSDLSSVVIGIGVLIFTFLIPVIVHFLSRRTVLITSCAGMTMALSILGTFFYVKDHTNINASLITWLPLISLLIVTTSYEMGLGILPWTITSELFPKKVKQVAAATVSSTCWIVSFMTTQYFNDFNDYLGSARTFWLFAIFCLCGTLFTVMFVPETKGKSLSQIQEEYHT